MSTRNPMNERYSGDGVQGKTRKSAASAKPANKAASSVHEPAKKTAKEKKAEAKQRQREAEARYAAERRVASQMNAEVEEQTVSRSTQYQRLRRRYWIFLAIGLVLTIVGWYVGTLNDMMGWPWLIIVLAYGCIVYAFYIDLVKIRRLYKQKSEQARTGKSKAARAQQKAVRAELRRQEAEAAAAAKAKAEAGEVEEEEEPGFFKRIGAKFKRN